MATTAAGPTKRSFAIAGHRTSVSLEPVFWAALKDAALARRQSVASLVAEIDRGRGGVNLSSAIRVWLFERILSELGRQAGDRQGGA